MILTQDSAKISRNLIQGIEFIENIKITLNLELRIIIMMNQLKMIFYY